MKLQFNHKWDLSESDAIKLQADLAQKVSIRTEFSSVKYIAGVDVAYSTEKVCAAVVVLDANTLEVIETSIATTETAFPYIPGLFSFRELPSIIIAMEKLNTTPDLIICDGQGLAHPRRFGLACHLGVLFDVPTIGCGKTKYTGDYHNLGSGRGSCAELVDNMETIGMALRTQTNINPIFVSIGHKINLHDACTWVLKAAAHYRLPETTRLADQAVKQSMLHAQSQ